MSHPIYDQIVDLIWDTTCYCGPENIDEKLNQILHLLLEDDYDRVWNSWWNADEESEE